MDISSTFLSSMKNPADLRTLGICCGKWILLAAVWNLWPYMGLVGRFGAGVLQCVWSFYVMTMVHNAMHCDVFRHRGVESAWRLILSATAGVPVEAYRPTHNLNHHILTQHGDHLDTKQMQYRWNFLNLVLFFPTVFPSIQKLESAYVSKEFKKLSPVFFLFIGQVACAHGATALLFCLDWKRAIFCWVVPYMVGADGIVTMNMLQHDGTEDIVLGEHKGEKMNVNSARNFTGPVINWFTCNNGYHAIHHMYAHMHWTQYPEMHDKLIKPRNDPSLNEPDILKYLWRSYIWPGKRPAMTAKKAE